LRTLEKEKREKEREKEKEKENVCVRAYGRVRACVWARARTYVIRDLKKMKSFINS